MCASQRLIGDLTLVCLSVGWLAVSWLVGRLNVPAILVC